MISNRDVEKSNIFKSVILVHTVSCVKFIRSYLLTSIGNNLLVYDIHTKCLILHKKIFDKASIHGIKSNNNESLLALHGENYVAVYKLTESFTNNFSMLFDSMVHSDDWICNVLWLNDNSLLSISAHNIAELWNFKLKKKIKEVSCDEQCILYSATSVGKDKDNVIVFSGTVFKEIVIWSPFRRLNDTNILHRLQKHEGVLFSIVVNLSNTLISSTSDDRRIIIWNVESFNNSTLYDWWKNAKICPKYSIYAHKARVWKSILLQSDGILSAGEDGQICYKASSSTYQWEESRGSQVRSLDFLEVENLIASGSSTGSIRLWEINSIPRLCILDDYKLQKRYPKHLVIIKNIGTIVLYSDGQVVKYKDDNNSIIYENKILCCTLTMTKSPCGYFILFTTSNGYIVILKSVDKEEFQVISRQISTTKISYSIWLDQGQIMTSSVENTICLYILNHSMHINQISKFNIASKANIWVTTAVKIGTLIFSGCNEGSIFIFHLNQKNPLQQFNKIHSFAGVTAIWLDEQISNFKVVSSVGRDGYHRYWSVSLETNCVFEIRSEILPTKWPFHINKTIQHGLLICGFKENNLIIYSAIDQRILASVFCGGGHRAWDISFANDNKSIDFVCSSSCGKLEAKQILLDGQYTLRDGFHSMIINSMAQIKDDLMVTGSDDTTVRLANFNSNLDNLLTLRSHISSVRSVSSLKLESNVYVIVTAGGRAQLKIWILKTDVNGFYCEESVSYLLKTKHEKKPWQSVPLNEGETRFMDISLKLLRTNKILIAVGCSDAVLRLYSFDLSYKVLCPVVETSDCSNCILKVLIVELPTMTSILSMDTRGYLTFWDISSYVENNELFTPLNSLYKNKFHQSGINCCDWLQLENHQSLVVTGGDDQSLCFAVFYLENLIILKSSVAITLHNSQVTGVKIYKKFVISSSVDQKVIFSSWSYDENTKNISINSLAVYFTTVADVHGLVSYKQDNVIRTIVYGQGVEMFSADMNRISEEPTVERCTEVLELGEGPHWDPSTNSLYFVDLHQGKIHRYHPDTNSHHIAHIEGYSDVTLVIPVHGKPNNYVVGLGASIGIVEWDGLSNETSSPKNIRLVDPKPGNRLNDGKVDASGRLWVGSMGPEMEDLPGHYHRLRGSLYSIELDGTIVKRLPNISISNGMAWSSNNKEFYYIDTYQYAVLGFDFDITTGELANPRVIFDLKLKNVSGDPDGMTIDTDGNLWVACFNSNHILKINPSNGKLMQSIKLPAYQITSAAFGGPIMDDLFVTTAGYQLTDEQYIRRPYSGALYKIRNTGSKGYPGVSAKID